MKSVQCNTLSNIVGLLPALAVCWGTVISSAPAQMNPPTWSPMTMLNVNFDTNTHKLDVVDQAVKMGTNVYAVLAVATNGTYDPAKPWGVLNGTAYSRRLGWDDPNKKSADASLLILNLITSAYGPEAGIWIDCIAHSPGLNAYLAIGKFGVNATNNATNADGTVIIDPTLNAYSGIFGTAGSSTKWRWDGKMDHNTYAVSLWDITAPNQLFTATYKVYVGDSQGNEILNPDGSSASTIEVWTWQGPASVATPEITILSKVAVEWPVGCTNYVLECAETLDSPEWTCVTAQPVSINGKSLILLDHQGAEQYFRLRLVR
jgi:hypothetical protein